MNALRLRHVRSSLDLAWRARYAALLLAFLIVGCSNEVRDTEGRLFSSECEKKTCSLTLLPSPENEPRSTSPIDDETEVPIEVGSSFDVIATGRILTACPSGSGEGFECRPLVCQSSSICSRLGGGDFGCEKELCQAVDRPLGPVDVAGLCLAGTGPFHRTAPQVERITLARASVGKNLVPSACRQP